MPQCNYALHLITDNRIDGLLELIAAAVDGGVTCVQLRNKFADKLPLYEVGKKIQTLLKPKKIPLIIYDHVDLAIALDADGVHIGQTDLPYEKVRHMLGKHKIIGLSLQTIEQAIQAQKYDVDYFGVGPIFYTETKTDAVVSGLTVLKAIAGMMQKACIAIGGIQISNVKPVIAQGAQGIAVVSGICAAENPKLATIHYVEELKNA